jgi:hypothetical protein
MSKRKIITWLKDWGVIIPIVMGAMAIGTELQMTKDNQEKIAVLQETVDAIRLRLVTDHIIDSIMFVKQGQIIRKLHIE